MSGTTEKDKEINEFEEESRSNFVFFREHRKHDL